MPAAESAIEPSWFVKLKPSAQAAIGNANASNARTITRLMFIPSADFFVFPKFHLEACAQGIGRRPFLLHLSFQSYKCPIVVVFQ
jgi:hypothetical protein